MSHKLRDVIEFGEALLKTEDLDPVYVAIYGAIGKDPKGRADAQLKRLLLAYWMFYHLGAAAWLSENEDSQFWESARIAADNKTSPCCWNRLLTAQRWPRGAERRHFRGQAAVEAVRWFYDHGMTPEGFVESLTLPARRTNGLQLDTVMTRAQAWPLFGPWIAFKAADMLERLLGLPIEFPHDLPLIYKEPRAALDLLNVPPALAMDKLVLHFHRYPAPPTYDRPCNVQEVETILCKWKSSLSGHYFIGKDIKEIRHGLKGWGITADRLLVACPKEVAHA